MLYDFFSKHMKTRLVLQILLDASPIVLMALAIWGLCVSNSREPLWQTHLIGVALWAFVALTVPLFIISIRTSKDLPEFIIYPFWGWVSLVLRKVSVIPLVVAIFVDVFLIACVVDESLIEIHSHIQYFTELVWRILFIVIV